MSQDEKPKSNGGSIPGASTPVIKDSLRAPLAKRFYNVVSIVEVPGGFAVQLDGRGIKTPAKRSLLVPTRALAERLAAEWDAQAERIDPGTMPLTRLVNSAIDAVADRMDEVRDDIASFAASDLLCYRAEAPHGLVQRQEQAWNPLLDWARDELGAVFRLRAGLMPIEQPAETLVAVRGPLAGLDALGLAALHVLTTISGSAVIALAHMHGKLDAAEAWAAATVDEQWQREQWGEDEEAAEVAAVKRREFETASFCLRQCPR